MHGKDSEERQAGERRYGQANNLEIDSRIPWRRSYAYVDTAGHRADKIFIRAELPVRFSRKEMGRDGTDYVVVFCSVKKQDERRFLKCMADLERAMIMEGRKDYPGFCAEVFAAFSQENGNS